MCKKADIPAHRINWQGILHIILLGIGSLYVVFSVYLTCFVMLNSRYYTLAHAVNEVVLRQPSMLQAGTLRDYQLVSPSARIYVVVF